MRRGCRPVYVTRGEIGDIKIHDVVGKLDGRRDGVIAQAKLSGERLGDAEIILRVEGESPAAKIGVGIAELARGIERQPLEKIGELVAGSDAGEDEAAARIRIRLRC